MNIESTKNFVAENGIATIKADKSLAEEEINQLLANLGNTGGTIPFYAIFPAGKPNDPILMDGVLTPGRVLEALKKAGPSQTAQRSTPIADQRG